jgi:ubiquitin-like protein Pup
MKEQSRKQHPEEDQPREQEVPTVPEAATADDLEDLLDEIDEVLEENAEEFVRNYVQKGGE